MSLVDAAFDTTTSGSEKLILTSDSDLIDAGQDNSGNENWVGASVDAFGTSRAGTWDVGAHEYVADALPMPHFIYG